MRGKLCRAEQYLFNLWLPHPDCDSWAFDAVDLPNIRECVDWGKRKAFIA
jgi:hypothetical protein